MKLPWKRKNEIKVSIMTKNEERYFSDLKDAQCKRDLNEKIAAYEKNLQSLAAFVNSCLASDGELPPVIPCRDELPELYKRLGNWKESERVIKHCIKCNAYYPENGNDALFDLLKYQKAAEKALELIKATPGILQKDIYKALKSEKLDDYSLKHFIRCSLQIKKVPENGTNKLFAV